MVSVVLGIALSACTSKPSYPITDSKLKEDITSYLTQEPNFSDIVSIELGNKTLAHDLFTVFATVEFKDETADIHGDMVVEYYKSESAWVRKAPVMVVNSAMAYVEPVESDILNIVKTEKLDRIGVENWFNFNYWFVDYTLTNKTVTLAQNKVIYEYTTEKTWNNCSASLTLGVDVRYTYEKGWQAVAITSEQFTETTTWDGTYQIQLDEAVSGTTSFPITLSGDYIISADSSGITSMDGTVYAKFTFDGIEYELGGSPGTVNNGILSGRRLEFYDNDSPWKQLVIILVWAGHETDPYLTYMVYFNEVTGSMAAID